MSRGLWIATCLVFLSVCLHMSSVSCEGYSSPDSYDTSVLILGAGAAGLQAARTLLEKNFTQFIILEGSDRTGGVLKKIQFGGLEIPSGHMWVKSPGLQHVDAHGLSVKKVNYKSFVVRNDHGEDVSSEFQEKSRDYDLANDKVYGIAEEVLTGERLDVSQKVALAMSGWVASSAVEHLVEWTQTSFDEGISSRHMSCVGPHLETDDRDDDEYEADYIITDYKDGLFPDVEARLIPGKNLKFDKIVENIDQSGDKVVVTTQGNHQYTADHVLVTFSVGVLQQGGVTFTPELPPWKTEQIFRYQRGTIDPIFMKFESNFWGDSEWIWHASERHVDPLYYPGFLNLEADGYHSDSKILVAFVTGEQAKRVEGLTDEQVKDEVLGILRSMFGEDKVSTLQEFYMERWVTNPFHYGLFSTWPVNANAPADAPQRLAAKVGRVFFAHQASDRNIGLTSGTIGASVRAMKEMSACIRGEECLDYEPIIDHGEETDNPRQLYGCVLVAKKPGKTRKVFPEGDHANTN